MNNRILESVREDEMTAPLNGKTKMKQHIKRKLAVKTVTLVNTAHTGLAYNHNQTLIDCDVYGSMN